VRALRPGANSISTDVCVPISRLAECVEETQRDIADMGLLAPIVGHVGEGNFHCLPLVDTNNAVCTENLNPDVVMVSPPRIGCERMIPV
jgi:D-lactate dehydrogenase (cytochrome)